MPSETRRVQLDAWAVFRKVAFVAFLFLEILAWQRLPGRRNFARPGHRLIYFLFHPHFTRQSLLLAPIVAGVITLVVFLVVRFVVQPLLDRWLQPQTDPSVGSFHMGPGERILASIPARKQSGRFWQPGSLILTDLRLWFFPEAWSMEPWSVARGEIGRVSTEPSWIARWLPVRNWPENVVAETRNGRRDLMAVADPASVVAWFSSPVKSPSVPQPSLR